MRLQVRVSTLHVSGRPYDRWHPPYLHPTSFPRRVGHVDGPVVPGCEDVTTEQELRNLNGAGAYPTEQELGNSNGARADLTEQELVNLNGAGAYPIEQELGNLNGA
ncbi:hypothetical protein GW17_00058657 [Ensete ventricosum]|nr:hypothetical protein GW17_00058657 [Ensete ventricosum]